MNQILKRLEIIKSGITIEDEEIIELQVMKLSKMQVDDDVKTILMNLENLDYSSAVARIESYLKRYSGVAKYIDTEAQGLKLELKSLEEKLQKLIEQKREYLNDIEEFNFEYNLHLGELIKDILNLKREILYKKFIKQQKAKEKYKEDIQTFQDTKETMEELKDTIFQLKDALEDIDEDDENYNEISSAYKELQEELEKLEDELSSQKEAIEDAKEFIEDEDLEKEYEEVKSSYEEFESDYENIKDEYESKLAISDEEKKELKKLYKKAARLCHPDIVPDELKEQANILMQKLNEAYSKQDLNEVRNILQQLESGSGFELSSDSINDKELLQEKIKKYKENIFNLRTDIENIEQDETYQLIINLDDWDEYFEGLRIELESEKERLEKEASEVLENKSDSEEEILKTAKIKEIEEWIQTIWDWADENNIPAGRLSRVKEKLLATTMIDFTGLKLKEIPNELCNLSNLTILILWDNDLSYLPSNIIKLRNLVKLNLRGNPKLAVTNEQNIWIQELSKKSIVFVDKLRVLDDGFDKEIYEKSELIKEIQDRILNVFQREHYVDLSTNPQIMLRISDEAKKVAKELDSKDSAEFRLNYVTYINNKPIHIYQKFFSKVEVNRTVANDKKQDQKIDEMKKSVATVDKIIKETSLYTTLIQSIQNPNFEKIRKYCENLAKENQADELQKYLGNNGKMHKALIYDALEQFIEKLNGQTITLVDWGCGQGIGSMLVLDYIKQKQLEIVVDEVVLIDDNQNAINRAKVQIEALIENNFNFSHLDKIKNSITVHLFIKDNIHPQFYKEDFNKFKGAYFVCITSENNQIVNSVYSHINKTFDVQNVSSRDDKIGKFKRYEKVFRII